MAIYHLSVKTVSRSAGRSATAAAAYRAGVKIVDPRTGEVHDYRRRRGVAYRCLILPEGAPQWARDRAELWGRAELAEVRRNASVAREVEVALPAELSAAARHRLACELAAEIVARHGCAVDVVVHAPSKEGDSRNWHAHLLMSTRRLGADGFGEKTREWDDRKTGPELVSYWRKRFEVLQNRLLQEAGVDARVSCETLGAQGIDREPTRHLGPAATGYERRTGRPSRRRLDQAAEAAEWQREVGEADRVIRALERELEVARREAAEAAQRGQGVRVVGSSLTRLMVSAAERLRAAQQECERQRRDAEQVPAPEDEGWDDWDEGSDAPAP